MVKVRKLYLFLHEEKNENEIKKGNLQNKILEIYKIYK